VQRVRVHVGRHREVLADLQQEVVHLVGRGVRCPLHDLFGVHRDDAAPEPSEVVVVGSNAVVTVQGAPDLQELGPSDHPCRRCPTHGVDRGLRCPERGEDDVEGATRARQALPTIGAPTVAPSRVMSEWVTSDGRPATA
jgi:hypothetical protein